MVCCCSLGNSARVVLTRRVGGFVEPPSAHLVSRLASDSVDEHVDNVERSVDIAMEEATKTIVSTRQLLEEPTEAPASKRLCPTNPTQPQPAAHANNACASPIVSVDLTGDREFLLPRPAPPDGAVSTSSEGGGELPQKASHPLKLSAAQKNRLKKLRKRGVQQSYVMKLRQAGYQA